MDVIVNETQKHPSKPTLLHAHIWAWEYSLSMSAREKVCMLRRLLNGELGTNRKPASWLLGGWTRAWRNVTHRRSSGFAGTQKVSNCTAIVMPTWAGPSKKTHTVIATEMADYKEQLDKVSPSALQ